MTAVLDGFGDMAAGHGVATVQVGHRARHALDAMAGACRQLQLVYRRAQQGLTGRIRGRDPGQRLAIQPADGRALPCRLPLVGGHDPLADLRRRLARRRVSSSPAGTLATSSHRSIRSSSGPDRRAR